MGIVIRTYKEIRRETVTLPSGQYKQQSMSHCAVDVRQTTMTKHINAF